LQLSQFVARLLPRRFGQVPQVIERRSSPVDRLVHPCRIVSNLIQPANVRSSQRPAALSSCAHLTSLPSTLETNFVWPKRTSSTRTTGSMRFSKVQQGHS